MFKKLSLFTGLYMLFSMVFGSVAYAADTTPPSLVSREPSNGAIDVPVTVWPSFMFDEPIDSATVIDSTFYLSYSGGNVPGTIDAVDETLTFQPTNELQPGVQYTLNGTTGLTDLSGNALAAAVSTSFTTVGSQIPNPLNVVSTDPANGATNVGIDANITVTFNNQSLFTDNGVIEVMDPSNNVVAGTYAENGADYAFDPTTNLNYATQYSVTVSGVQDSLGNSMEAPYQFSFTTETAPVTCELTAPVLKTPANGALDQEKNLKLTWDAVSGVTSYHLVVSENADLSTPIFEGDVNATEKDLTLENGKTYYWQVSVGSGDCKRESEKWNFKVKAASNGGGGNGNGNGGIGGGEEEPPVIPPEFVTPVSVSLGDAEGFGGGSELPEAGMEALILALVASGLLTAAIRLKKYGLQG